MQQSQNTHSSCTLEFYFYISENISIVTVVLYCIFTKNFLLNTDSLYKTNMLDITSKTCFKSNITCLV